MKRLKLELTTFDDLIHNEIRIYPKFTIGNLKFTSDDNCHIHMIDGDRDHEFTVDEIKGILGVFSNLVMTDGFDELYDNIVKYCESVLEALPDRLKMIPMNDPGQISYVLDCDEIQIKDAWDTFKDLYKDKFQSHFEGIDIIWDHNDQFNADVPEPYFSYIHDGFWFNKTDQEVYYRSHHSESSLIDWISKNYDVNATYNEYRVMNLDALSMTRYFDLHHKKIVREYQMSGTFDSIDDFKKFKTSVENTEDQIRKIFDSYKDEFPDDELTLEQFIASCKQYKKDFDEDKVDLAFNGHRLSPKKMIEIVKFSEDDTMVDHELYMNSATTYYSVLVNSGKKIHTLAKIVNWNESHGHTTPAGQVAETASKILYRYLNDGDLAMGCIEPNWLLAVNLIKYINQDMTFINRIKIMYYMNLVLLKADFDGIEYQYFRGGERVNYHYLNQFTLDQLINESEVTVNGVTLKFNDDQQYIEVSYKEGGSEKYDYSLPLLGVRSIKKYLNAGDFNCDYHTCVMGSITEYDPTDNAPEMTAILFAAMIEATDADPDFMKDEEIWDLWN